MGNDGKEEKKRRRNGRKRERREGKEFQVFHLLLAEPRSATGRNLEVHTGRPTGLLRH